MFLKAAYTAFSARTALFIITMWAGQNIDDERFRSFGWRMIFYDLPLINAIILPTAIAVFASRIIDMEHKGNTWKMLETAQSKLSIYFTKLLYGFIAVFLFSLSESLIFMIIGYIAGFEGSPDLWAYGLFFVQTLTITFNIFMLQMIISLIFPNQAVALCIGLCGSMAGLFLMYVPQWLLLRNIVPWGHYGASMFVGMDYEGNTILDFYYMRQDNGAEYFIAGWFFLLLAGGWIAFRNTDTDGVSFHFASRVHRKPVKIPRLPVELIKIKRTPIWIAFFILPLISAFIGTANYMNNIGILQSTWFSLWTQHSLFFCYFFMPPLIGVYASYLWRLEHSGSNWNMALVNTSAWHLVFSKIAVCAAMSFITFVWLCLLYILGGRFAGITEPVPAELAEWLACGVLGSIAVCAIQSFFSLVIRSFAIPIGMALAGGFMGLLVTSKGYYYLLPYSLMSVGMRANNPWRAVDYTELVSYSLFFIVLFYLLNVWYISSHDVKTQ